MVDNTYASLLQTPNTAQTGNINADLSAVNCTLGTPATTSVCIPVGWLPNKPKSRGDVSKSNPIECAGTGTPPRFSFSLHNFGVHVQNLSGGASGDEAAVLLHLPRERSVSAECALNGRALRNGLLDGQRQVLTLRRVAARHRSTPACMHLCRQTGLNKQPSNSATTKKASRMASWHSSQGMTETTREEAIVGATVCRAVMCSAPVYQGLRSWCRCNSGAGRGAQAMDGEVVFRVDE